MPDPEMLQILGSFGASPALLSEAEQAALDEQGYLFLPGLLEPAAVEVIVRRFDELVEAEGDQAGLEAHREAGTDRLANLVDKDPLFDLCWNNPRQLSAIAHVLQWQPEKVFSLNGRSSRPGQGHQNLHVDWSAAVEPGDYQITNSIWMLDDFTPENGATRVVPGSHRWGRLPREALADPGAPHPDEVLVLGKAGTCVVFNSHLWHGGTLNRTDAPRRAIHAAFVRRDQQQQTVFADYMHESTYERLNPAQRYLLAV
ncbi:MAG TPA: phytanoyl-CoA dioxygenase family protein [Streptosporangiaceae bacterium]|jgi:ectoine hydroxylase-related dioxygenase (phytanoyl-CoA dioxygenase family)|nr:phytanoyl-CoA dioxygenase family protein [Streptosporangiaceae bacterium]